MPPLSELDFALAVETTETTVGEGASTPITLDDSHFDQIEAATINVAGQVRLSALAGEIENVRYRSSNPAIGTVNELTGAVTRVSNGTVKIIARSPLRSRKINVTCSQVGGGTVNVLTGFKAGSFAAACAGIYDLLSDGKSVDIYSQANFGTRTYVRNPNCWAAGIDLTCYAAGNSYLNRPYLQGILITPKHVTMANHASVPIGSVFHYVTQDNVCHAVTLANKTRVGSTDLVIGTFDEELPSSITPAKVLPADWREYVGNPYGDTTATAYTTFWTSRIPIFSQNQYRKAWVFEMNATTDFTGPPSYGYHSVSGRYPTVPPASNFTGTIIGGDSGGTLSVLHGVTPAAVFGQHAALGGPDFGQYLTETAAICDPYELAILDLTSHEKFV